MENLFKNSLLKHSLFYQLASVTFVAGFLYAVVEVFRGQLYFVLDASTYLPFHNVVEFLTIVVSLSVFSVGWFSYRQSKNNFTLFIGVMLLGVGVLDFMHAMSFPGMPGIVFPGTTNRGIQFWILARLLFAASFLIGAFISSARSSRKIPRYALLLPSVFISILVSFFVLRYQDQIPLMFIEVAGLTPLKIFFEYTIISLLLLALVAFYFRYTREKDEISVLCMQAFILSIFSELAFTLYASAYDTFNLLGHIFKIAAFYLIYKAIFISSIAEPYSEVRRSEDELKKANRALKVISGCNQALVYSGDEKELLQDVCDVVVNVGGYLSAWFGYAENDEHKSILPAAQAGVKLDAAAAPAGFSWSEDERGYGPEGSAIRTGETVMIRDILADRSFSSWRKVAIKQGCKSMVAIPLSLDEQIIGVFCIYSAEVEAFGQDEMDLLTELSDDLSYGITALRARHEKKTAEAKTKFSEDKFAKAFYSSPNLMAITTLKEGRIVEINDAYCAVIGYRQEECIGHTTAELKIWAKPGQRQEVIKQIREQGSARDVEADLRRPNGEIVTVVLSMEPIRVGDTDLLLSVATDITVRKRMETELRRTHEYLERLIASANVMIVGLDIAGKVRLFNAAAEKVTGYTRNELLGVEWFEKVVPKDRFPSVWETFESFQQGKAGMPMNFENPILTKSGEERFISWQNSTVTSPDREISTISFGVDVTETERVMKALQTSEHHLKEAQEIARIGNWDWDALKDVIFWSDEYYRIFGFDPKTAPPNYVEHLKAYTAESAKRLDAAVKLAMETGEPYELDLELAKPTASTRWIVARGEAKRDSTGKIWGLRGTAQDITRKKETELKIAELGEVRSRFLDIISHQLRTPLASVIWNLETLLTGHLGKLSKAQEKFLRHTYESSGNINNRLNDLLMAIDVEEGRELVKVEDVSLDSMVVAVMDDMKAHALAKGLELTYDKPKTALPEIKGDGEKLRFVIQKMMDNAVVYSNKGGKITIRLSKKGSRAHFEVEDTGVGIPSLERHHVFERFFRASNASAMQPDSFGLDLYMAKHFITQHSGDIGFRSKEGVGSTFWFEIPLRAF